MSNTEPTSLAIAPESIGSRIFLIRDTQVMLDRDLAEFYEVKPIRLREQIKRNAERFPFDFMFQLTDAEVDIMVSQSAIPSRQHLGIPLKDLGKQCFAFSRMDDFAEELVLKIKDNT